LEVTILEDCYSRVCAKNLSNDEADRLLRLKHLGRSLAALRYKEA